MAPRRTIFVAGIVLLTLAVLLFTVQYGPLYPTFYESRPKPPGLAPFGILLIACCGLLTFAALHKNMSAWKFLPIAMAVGTFAQFGFAYTEGRGFDGLRSRATAGHGQFINAALITEDAGALLRDYEPLAASGRLGLFPRSKPPGTLLFYVLTERVSRVFVPHTYDERERSDRLVNFLTTVWPFVATLAIFPLYWLASQLAGPAEARIAAALYLLVPSFSLVTLHTDQVLYPLLFLFVLALFVWSLRVRSESARIAGGVTTGVVLCVAVFCHFPLGLAAVLCASLWLAAFVTDPRPRRDRIRSTMVLAGSVAAGLIVPSLVLWMAFDYNPLVRWREALAFHAAWRRAPAIVSLLDGSSSIAEFIDWTGVPICLLALAVFWIGRAERGTAARNLSAPHVALMASLVPVIAYLAFLSRTRAETARLWIFLMPVMCLVAARTLSEVRTTHRYAAPVVFALQFATVYVIKITHDFW